MNDMADEKHSAMPSGGRLRHSADKRNRVDFNWHIVRTLPHQEKKLAAIIAGRIPETENILEVYCPTHTTVRTAAGAAAAESPLFAGFVFVLSTEEALTDFISRHYPDGTVLRDRKPGIGCKAGLLTVPESQMRAFRDFNENYADRVVVLERPYSDYAFNPKTGEPNEIVRVIDGPLAGREGYLVRFRRDKRMVFNIKSFYNDRSLAVSIPNVWNFHVVRLHNAAGDRLSRATEKARAADLLIGIIQACGCGGQSLSVFHTLTERLAARPSLTFLCRHLYKQGDTALAARLESLTAAEAALVMNLVRYERDNPGYIRATWPRLTLRPFLTPTSGAAIADGTAEATLRHDGFTEIIRRVEIAEDVYSPAEQKSETVTTTYYAHIGVMESPSPALPRGERAGADADLYTHPQVSLPTGESRRGASFLLFANWDDFLREYFLTAGKANEKLVSGTERASRGATTGGVQKEKLIDSFRNYAPTLYNILTDAGSPVKALQAIPVGGDTLNALAITASPDSLAAAKDLLIGTCTAICRELNTTTHLAVWRRYLRTVWLHS